MNTRICSVVATVTLLTLSTGCSGMRNFLFGRGARCGLCNRLDVSTPSYDTVQQAPCGSTCPTYGTTVPQNVVTGPQVGCGCVTDSCGSCGTTYGSAYGGSCGCGVAGQYTVDPYLSGGTIVDGAVGNGVIMEDDFHARRYDSQGDLIISEDSPRISQ